MAPRRLLTMPARRSEAKSCSRNCRGMPLAVATSVSLTRWSGLPWPRSASSTSARTAYLLLAEMFTVRSYRNPISLVNNTPRERRPSRLHRAAGAPTSPPFALRHPCRPGRPGAASPHGSSPLPTAPRSPPLASGRRRVLAVVGVWAACGPSAPAPSRPRSARRWRGGLRPPRPGPRPRPRRAAGAGLEAACTVAQLMRFVDQRRLAAARRLLRRRAGLAAPRAHPYPPHRSSSRRASGETPAPASSRSPPPCASRCGPAALFAAAARRCSSPWGGTGARGTG